MAGQWHVSGGVAGGLLGFFWENLWMLMMFKSYFKGDSWWYWRILMISISTEIIDYQPRWPRNSLRNCFGIATVDFAFWIYLAGDFWLEPSWTRTPQSHQTGNEVRVRFLEGKRHGDPAPVGPTMGVWLRRATSEGVPTETGRWKKALGTCLIRWRVYRWWFPTIFWRWFVQLLGDIWFMGHLTTFLA